MPKSASYLFTAPKSLGVKHDHVGLPKSQALLTLEDLHRLPAFYREAKFRPGEELEVEDIQQDVERLLHKPLLFRPHAQRVLRDDRRHLAYIQIRDHLRQWNKDVVCVHRVLRGRGC